MIRFPKLNSYGNSAAARRFMGYACFVAAFTLAVILWGAYVRASGSGAGCGAHWPLCNGMAIPDTSANPATSKTWIEYAHRITSGLDGLLVLALAAWAFARFPRGHRVRQAAALAVVFIVTESLIGAGLVKLRLVGDNASVARAFYLSVHLTNTFILIAALVLTAWWSRTEKANPPRPWAFLRGPAAAALLAALAIGVSGAVAALGATLFPYSAPQGSAELGMSAAAHLMFSLKYFKLHPLTAMLAGSYVAHFAMVCERDQKEIWVRRWAFLVVTLVVVQFAAGMLNAALMAPIWLQLTHLLLANLLWTALVLLSAASGAIEGGTQGGMGSPSPRLGKGGVAAT